MLTHPEAYCYLFSLVGGAEVKDTFDWAKYLMEDEDVECGPYPDTPVGTPSPPRVHRVLKSQVWSELCVVVITKETLINQQREQKLNNYN